jgi:hypothetical protein
MDFQEIKDDIHAIIDRAEALIAKAKAILPAPVQAEVKTVENEVHTIVHSAVDYIKSKGLQDVYVLATDLLTGAVGGAPWGQLLADLISKAAAMGKALLHEEAGVVLGLAQADLIALGKLVAPAPSAPATEA